MESRSQGLHFAAPESSEQLQLDLRAGGSQQLPGGASRPLYNQRTRFCAKLGIDVAIELEKNVVFDNDVLRGTLHLNADAPVTLVNPVALLLCRFIPAKYTQHAGKFATLVVEKVLIGHSLLELEAGESSVKFDFTIPEYSPASFRSPLGECLWTVRFLAEYKRDGIVSLGSRDVTKCTLLHPLPGFVPTCQAETTLLQGVRVCAEARLAKNVFSPDEAIELALTVRQAALDQALDVRKVKAKLVQYVLAISGGSILCRDMSVVESARLTASSLQQAAIYDDNGLIVSRCVSLRASLEHGKSMAAYSRMVVPEGVEAEADKGLQRKVPAPSCRTKFYKDTLEVRYEVQVSIKFLSADSIDLVIPLSFESEPPMPYARRDVGDEGARIFPRLDMLPSYKNIETHSTPSSAMPHPATAAAAGMAPSETAQVFNEIAEFGSFDLLPQFQELSLASQIIRGNARSKDSGGEGRRSHRKSSSAAHSVLSLVGVDCAESMDSATARTLAQNAIVFQAQRAARRISRSFRRKSYAAYPLNGGLVTSMPDFRGQLEDISAEPEQYGTNGSANPPPYSVSRTASVENLVRRNLIGTTSYSSDEEEERDDSVGNTSAYPKALLR